MENQRVFLYTGLAFLLFLVWQQWQVDYVLPKPEPEATQVVEQGVAVDGTVSNTATSGETISVSTDVITAEISLNGGEISKLSLVDYSVSLEKQDEQFVLLDRSADLYNVAQSGLQGTGVGLPDHRATYSAEKTSYTLEGDQLVVPMTWQQDGVTVTKSLTFTKGSYQVEVDYTIEGAPAGSEGRYYAQIQRTQGESTGGLGQVYSYTGGVYSYSEERYNKYDFGDMADSDLKMDNIKGGWVAMIQHYFAAAVIPPQDDTHRFYSTTASEGRIFSLGIQSAKEAVGADGTLSLSHKYYIGPKIQEKLDEAAPFLRLTVDFGWLSFVAEILFSVLKFFHQYVGNWGWSIILLTLLIKLIFFPLSKMSYTSMAKMKQLTPKIQAIREQYSDDQAKMGQETMNLYRKEKVNPLGGCIPILLQFPVFIALYWMLAESVELRQAPWIGWIQDLSIKDPWFILPVIYMITMFIQQRLNPPPADPIQQKIFQWMPVMFGVFFMFFPAGLVLYWVVNNTLTIAQQWTIMRNLEKKGLK